MPGATAAYAFGIAKNHPFFDGNKRTALLVMNAFLLDHGHDIAASDAALLEAILVTWIRENLTRDG